MTGRTSVLIVGPYNDPVLPRDLLGLAQGHARRVIDSVRRVGLEATFLDTAEHPLPSAGEALTDVDAVVLLGGGDVSPDLYGRTDITDGLYGVDERVDRFLVRLLQRSSQQGLPVLGICKGMQIVNVAFGGTLIPDIENWELHRGKGLDEVFIQERVALASDTRMHTVYGAEQVVVMTGHHQAVDQVAAGFTVAAWAADGLVEALESTEHNILAVQWHPEHAQADPGKLDGLMGDLLARSRPRERTP